MPEEVQVVVDGPTITGARDAPDVRVEEGLQSYCMEISYNQFARTLTLPCDLSRNGCLHRLPRWHADGSADS